MLGDADIEGGADENAALVARAFGDDLRTQRIGAQKAVGAVLLGRADGDQDRLRLGQIGFDFRPGGEMELHGRKGSPLR